MEDKWGQVEICDYTDFPSFGQTLRNLVLQGDPVLHER